MPKEKVGLTPNRKEVQTNPDNVVQLELWPERKPEQANKVESGQTIPQENESGDNQSTGKLPTEQEIAEYYEELHELYVRR